MFVQIHPLFLHISRIRSSPTAHNYNDEQKDQDQCPESGSTDNDGKLPRHHTLRTVSTLISEELLLRTPYKRNRICWNMLLTIYFAYVCIVHHNKCYKTCVFCNKEIEWIHIYLTEYTTSKHCMFTSRCESQMLYMQAQM